MSSVHIDASGARALTTTINDPARTVAQVPTKADDDLSITVSGVNGQLEVVVPPSLVTVERLDRGGDDQFLRLTFRGGISAARFTKVDPDAHGWPHASISARKGIERQWDDAPAVELGTLADVLALGGMAEQPAAE